MTGQIIFRTHDRMKTKYRFFFITLAVFASLLSTARATVTFTTTPASVSNTYVGPITLQIGGLAKGDNPRPANRQSGNKLSLAVAPPALLQCG